jgi:hypothetical protein
VHVPRYVHVPLDLITDLGTCTYLIRSVLRYVHIPRYVRGCNKVCAHTKADL